MADSGIPLGQWSGSDATDRLREVVTRFNETAEKQGRTMIRLTWAIVGLTVALVVGLGIQVVTLLA